MHDNKCPILVNWDMVHCDPTWSKKPLLCDKVVCNQQFFVQMDEDKNDGKWHLNHLLHVVNDDGFKS